MVGGSGSDAAYLGRSHARQVRTRSIGRCGSHSEPKKYSPHRGQGQQRATYLTIIQVRPYTANRTTTNLLSTTAGNKPAMIAKTGTNPTNIPIDTAYHREYRRHDSVYGPGGWVTRGMYAA